MKPQILGRTPGAEHHFHDLVAKQLARSSNVSRHDYFRTSHPSGNGQHCETWRFPVVEPHFDSSASPDEYSRWNEVTFAFRAELGRPLSTVSVIGLNIADLRSVPLGPVGGSLWKNELGRDLIPGNFDANTWQAADNPAGPKVTAPKRESFMAVDYMDLHILQPECAIGIHRHRDNREVFFMFGGCD